MPIPIESRLNSKPTTRPITITDFKTEMFDGLPQKKFVSRDVIEDRKGPYYQIFPERLKAQQNHSNSLT